MNYIQEGKSDPIPDRVKTIMHSMLMDICQSAICVGTHIVHDCDADVIHNAIKSLLDRALIVRVRFDVEMEKERIKEKSND